MINDITEEDFVIAATRRIKNAIPESVYAPEDMETVLEGLPSLYRDGFTVTDAVHYSLCFEEINSTISEENALRRMDQIRSRYIKK